MLTVRRVTSASSRKISGGRQPVRHVDELVGVRIEVLRVAGGELKIMFLSDSGLKRIRQMPAVLSPEVRGSIGSPDGKGKARKAVEEAPAARSFSGAVVPTRTSARVTTESAAPLRTD